MLQSGRGEGRDISLVNDQQSTDDEDHSLSSRLVHGLCTHQSEPTHQSTTHYSRNSYWRRGYPSTLNPQLSNPQQSNPQLSNPQLSNPQRSNPQRSNPQQSNPQQSNPQRSNPQLSNPQLSNPQRSNPQRSNPQRSNPQRSNPQRSNPQRSNPQLSNPQQSNPQLSNPQLSNPQRSNPQQSNPQETLTLANSNRTEEAVNNQQHNTQRAAYTNSHHVEISDSDTGRRRRYERAKPDEEVQGKTEEKSVWPGNSWSCGYTASASEGDSSGGYSSSITHACGGSSSNIITHASGGYSSSSTLRPGSSGYSLSTLVRGSGGPSRTPSFQHFIGADNPVILATSLSSLENREVELANQTADHQLVYTIQLTEQPITDEINNSQPINSHSSIQSDNHTVTGQNINNDEHNQPINSGQLESRGTVTCRMCTRVAVSIILLVIVVVIISGIRCIMAVTKQE
ncbi:hypothetical protein EB796_016992 [Bugula neritina]|uniref:Uncharacterized protein n=1 Tax=Bugula neritina TaxID=10212 RepID=A0A7J7JGH4_BUGNE|nr:hypothetical protein EB796_016992 [Bugula neritina]